MKPRADARQRRKPVYPRALEAAYNQQLQRRASALYSMTVRGLRPILGEQIRAQGRQDGPAEDFVAGLRALFAGPLAPSESALTRTANRTELFATRQVAADLGIRRIPSVVPEDLTAQWVTENVSLIETIDSRFFDDVETILADAYKEGQSTKSLIAEIEARYGVTQWNAERIARDQIGSLNGQTTQYRHEEFDVEEYEWSTSGDERVRPLHRRLDGNIYRWDSAGPDGHPGRAILCRCVAIAVL